MRLNRLLKAIVTVAALAALFTVPMLFRHQSDLQAQGYSGAMPNVLTPASGLVVTYTNGTIAVGGTQQSITTNTVTVSDNQTSCLAPAYTACNFVFWTSGTSLSTSTSATTAFTAPNVVVAYVTSSGGNVTAITPTSWAPSVAAATLTPTGTQNTAGAYWVSPGNCYFTTSGGTFVAQTGVGVAGATGLSLVASAAGVGVAPVMQIATTNAGTATNTITCLINPPSTVGVTGRGVNLVDATFFYGVQQTGLGAQASVLASGTMNGALVFSKIAFPAAGAGETPSTVAPVRADAGTLVITPVVASFNVATTTAGAFFTAKFAPQTTFSLSTDLTQYYVSLTVLCTATSATTLNTPGVLIHFTS